LFGWSAAGGLTFEVAKALESNGCDVSDIIFADCYWTKEKIPVDSGEDQAFFRHIETVLEGWGMAFLKERVRGRAEKYMSYIRNLTSLEMIHANVHLIVSEQTRQGDDKNMGSNWDKFTHRSVMTYNGFGSHDNMFEPGALEKNAELIREILTKIAAKNKKNPQNTQKGTKEELL
jgi:thioesterase domain-containing protein